VRVSGVLSLVLLLVLVVVSLAKKGDEDSAGVLSLFRRFLLLVNWMGEWNAVVVVHIMLVMACIKAARR